MTIKITPSDNPKPMGMFNYKEIYRALKGIALDGGFIDLLNESKVFEIDNDISILLLNTNNNKYFIHKLPFKSIFIDTTLRIDYEDHQEHLFGVFIKERDGNNEIIDICCYAKVTKSIIPLEDINGGKYLMNHHLYCFTTDNNRKPQHQYNNADMNLGYKVEDGFTTPSVTSLRTKIIEYINNFLNFINDPDVELHSIIRTEKANTKRLKKGKIPLPPSEIVHIKGVLYKYVNALKLGGHFSYSHKFWVRGHWRTLENERWKNKRGLTIWIPPFIKGSGILIDKRYRLE